MLRLIRWISADAPVSSIPSSGCPVLSRMSLRWRCFWSFDLSVELADLKFLAPRMAILTLPLLLCTTDCGLCASRPSFGFWISVLPSLLLHSFSPFPLQVEGV